jgi:hypothetical protein
MKKVLSLLVLAGALGLVLGCGGSPTTAPLPKASGPPTGSGAPPMPPGGSAPPKAP